jgi:hypothetical protein
VSDQQATTFHDANGRTWFVVLSEDAADAIKAHADIDLRTARTAARVLPRLVSDPKQLLTALQACAGAPNGIEAWDSGAGADFIRGVYVEDERQLSAVFDRAVTALLSAVIMRYPDTPELRRMAREVRRMIKNTKGGG